MTMQEIANSIPHEYRRKILLEWIPRAKAQVDSDEFMNLFEAYYIYVDTDGVKNLKCPKCRQNILDNWKSLQKFLIVAEQNYNLLEKC